MKTLFLPIPTPATTQLPWLSLLESISQFQSQMLIAIKASHICFKLTKANYMAWGTQFQNLLFEYDLLRFVDGINRCPPKTVMSSTPGTSIPNQYWKFLETPR